jgi:NAD-dependent SIR2 family protein deacetylase
MSSQARSGRTRREAAVDAAVGPLAALLDRGPALVVTGAGISTDSGIPDYRDPAGRLRHVAPMTYDRFRGSALERQRYWARSHLGWPRFSAARPNVSHLAVTDLQRAGGIVGVVTQNVDGLHAVAGSEDAIDLHGRLDRVVCLGCGVRRPRLEVGLRLDAVNPGFRAGGHGAGGPRPDGDSELDDERVRRFRVVDCRRCRGLLKPDVVFFGERVPAARFQHALARLDEASSLLVLGSSLMVGSGYRFVTAARRRGLPVAIVNRGVTRGDPHATLRVDARLAPVLVGLRTAVLGGAAASAGPVVAGDPA